MNLNNIIFLLLGLLISLLITYLWIIRKFNNFINEEIDNNKIYRSNAETDFKASESTLEASKDGE